LQDIEHSWTKVYVGNLDPGISFDEFKQLFEPYGKVLSPFIMRNKKGFSGASGFVNFVRHEDAKAAVEALNGQKVRNKTIACRRAMKPIEILEHETKLKQELECESGQSCLYVKNFGDVGEEMLRRTFAAFGEVKSCKIIVDEKGNSKGFGFVYFSTADEAQKAIIGLNSNLLRGQKNFLFVRLHVPKEALFERIAHSRERKKERRRERSVRLQEVRRLERDMRRHLSEERS
jgi:polyadenylate-binding protein